MKYYHEAEKTVPKYCQLVYLKRALGIQTLVNVQMCNPGPPGGSKIVVSMPVTLLF